MMALASHLFYEYHSRTESYKLNPRAETGIFERDTQTQMRSHNHLQDIFDAS